MSIKRTNCLLYIQNRQSNGFQQRTSGRYTSKDEKPIPTISSDTLSIHYAEVIVDYLSLFLRYNSSTVKDCIYAVIILILFIASYVMTV
jgi:hypothetical protein